MNKIELVKAGIGLIVSVGVGAIVGNAVKATTPGTIKGLSKFIVSMGSLAITGMTSYEATKYTEGRIDEIVDAVKQMFEGKETEKVIEIVQ